MRAKAKILSIITVVLLMLICLSVAVCAAEKQIIYPAEKLLDNGSVTGQFYMKLITDPDGDYLKLTATRGGTIQYYRFDTSSPTSSSDEYKPEFLFKEYPVVAIRYRTNLASSTRKLPINASLLLTKTNNYERCWALNTDLVSNGQWRKAIIDIRTFNGYADDKGKSVGAKAEHVDPKSGIQYIRIPVWAHTTPASNLANEYFDMKWIGFFKTVEDAENYEGKDPEIRNFFVTYKNKDGKEIEKIEYAPGSSATPITAEVIAEMKFLGWKNDDGELVKKAFEVNDDITLTATYEPDLEQIAANKRKAEIASAIRENKTAKHTPFIKGYDGFLFKPDNNMTRAEACTVITRLLVDEASVKGKYTSNFSDLEQGAWYYSNIAYLESLGYLKNYDGKFEPDKNITRAEFVELVYAMGKVKADPAKKLTFSDVTIEHPRYEVIMASASAGLVGGRPNGTFDPDGTIKRSEVVKVLCAALGRTLAADSFTDVVVAGFNDITEEHWAHAYVLEASFEHTSAVLTSGEAWMSVTDNNDYMLKVPDGLEARLDAEFDERKNKILNTKSEWKLGEGGKIWYISESGKNSGSGTSPDDPIKSLAKLMELQKAGTVKSGDVVLFKRGDEWHGKFTVAEGVTYSAYGEGAKPRLLGSVEADRPAQWKETDIKGVYRYSVSVSKEQDVGNIVFNDGECYGMRLIPDNGKTLAAGDNNLVSNGINKWTLPPKDFTGIETIAEIASEIPEADLMYWHDREGSKLYLYSRTGNPGERFNSIELCTRGNAVSIGNKHNVTIDNLCIKFTGSHGIGSSATKNLTVRNCEIGWIGGSIQNEASTTRFGNAVEVFGAVDGFYVYNNYMYQCFDCGPTVQWQGTLKFGEPVIEKNVFFYDNVLNEASLEVWMSVQQENTDDAYAILENCKIYNNMVTGSGTGFKAYNHQKFEWCSFYGGGNTYAPYIDCYMENNYFWGNRRHILKAVPTGVKKDVGFVWRGNTIIHPYGEGSIGSLGTDIPNAAGKDKQYFYDSDTVNMLVKNGCFGVNKFYYTPGDPANKRQMTGITN